MNLATAQQETDSVWSYGRLTSPSGVMHQPTHRTVDMTNATIFLAAVMAVSIAAPSNAQTVTENIESQKTAAGAIATDQHWSRAETYGDTTFLSALLLPGYRSISHDGVAYTRAQILAGAAKRGQDTVASIAAAAAYRKAHPYAMTVVIDGNTAVLSFYSPALGPEKGVKSSDILIFEQGRWHALYSQHSDVQ